MDLECFLVASLFCNEDHRSSSRDSKESKHCSMGVVSGRILIAVHNVGIHTRWEYGFDPMN
jgi:hypothetical protein